MAFNPPGFDFALLLHSRVSGETYGFFAALILFLHCTYFFFFPLQVML